ncbi:MAG: cation:dicarboxylase symporter family transporter, partial [Thermoanaerobaculia bacterium]
LVTAPVLAAAGLPTAAVALLLAVDSIPNAFRSAANSTGNMVVAAVLGPRVEEGPAAERGAAPEPG